LLWAAAEEKTPQLSSMFGKKDVQRKTVKRGGGECENYVLNLNCMYFGVPIYGLLSMNKSAEQFCADDRDQALVPILGMEIVQTARPT